MPLVGFTPTKARLVLEENKESVLVMKVTLAKGESVELATGGKLQALTGVIRVRERRTDNWQGNGKGVGTLVYVDAGRGGARESAKFQINISMSTKKFDALLKVAISGRLPSKFFVDAGEKVSRTEMRGLTYRMAPKGRTKVWDNRLFPFLPVTNFSAIIPISVPEPPPAPAAADADADQSPLESQASYGQMVELAEELAVFRSETNHTLMAIVWLFAALGLLALLFGLSRFFW
jgi:hypothetical protein